MSLRASASDPKKSLLLAVDTALGGCSVALLDGDRVLAHLFEAMDRGHAERLAPMVEENMRRAETKFSELDCLAVTTGPGTFTGQRVGLAFMRGLRLALRIPLTGITTLEAIAAAAMEETGQSRAAVIHDARRSEAYLLLQDGADIVLAPAVMPFADAVHRIAGFGPCAVAGTGTAAAVAVLGPDFTASTVRQPDALWVGRLARRRPALADAPGPLYLRAPDAKLPGGKALVEHPA
jgi:tRNA threonylcarbamoyladenosine biosynthesis protein TsaB